MSHSTQRARIREVRSQLRALEGPTGRTVKRADEIVARFELFLERAYDISHIGDVTAQHVELFVNAKGSTGETATATKHVKRTVLRLFFRIARQEFGYQGDPTVDLILPSRTMLKARPLTEDEAMLGRSYSRRTTRESRQPAAWALCEATAVTANSGTSLPKTSTLIALAGLGCGFMARATEQSGGGSSVTGAQPNLNGERNN